MRILIVTHYFPPEIGAPQARLSDLARMWAEMGHDVHVLTGMPNHPTGVIPPEYAGRIRISEEIDGYRVTRCWLYATPNEGIVKKTIGHLSFMVSSVVLGFRRIGRPDVVVVSSPTFFSIGSAWLLGLLKRSRLVIEVRDLWPAIFVELGVLSNRHVIRALEAVELAAYRSADAVVTVSAGFTEDIRARGIRAARVHTVRNGVDTERFIPSTEQDEAWRSALGDADKALVLYIGAHGISQGLPSVVEAAALLVDEPVHFALVGEGADKSRVLERIEELGLSNVTTHPGVGRDEVQAVLSAADVCLVPLRDVPLFSTFIPSKIFELLAVGKPIVASLEGESAQILSDAGQIVVPPEGPEALAEALRALCSDPDRRAAMSTAGRRFVENEFDRRVLARRYEEILEQVVGGS
jgi:glycosyltransferase involved in cell wall biosynthesis